MTIKDSFLIKPAFRAERNSLFIKGFIVRLLLLLLILASCTTPMPEQKQPKEIVWAPNKQVWIGKSEEVLALHPIFATLPVESRKTPGGVETRRYTQGGSITSQDCKDNQCSGVYNASACNHVFYLEKKMISNYHRVGNCGVESLQLRPLDKDGNPEYTEIELAEAREISEYNKNLASENTGCKSRADCESGMSCKITDRDSQTGICVNHGLFGKLLYK